MLVRFVEEHRRGTETLSPGSILEFPDDEAMVLVRDGAAVPHTAPVAVETRQLLTQPDNFTKGGR